MWSPGPCKHSREVVTLFISSHHHRQMSEGNYFICLPTESFHLQQMPGWDHGSSKSQAWVSSSYLHEDTSGQKCWLSGPIILHKPKQANSTFLLKSQ